MRSDIIKWFAGLTVEEASVAIVGSGKQEEYVKSLAQSAIDYSNFVHDIMESIHKDGMYEGSIWIMTDTCGGNFKIGEEHALIISEKGEYGLGPMLTSNAESIRAVARRKE